MNEVIKSLIERRSCRQYKAEQISDEELNTVLEAGTFAPTAMGRQDPIMVAVQDPETLAWMDKANAAFTGNPDGHPFYGAPTVVVVLAPRASGTAMQDGSLVMGNLLNAAYALGLGCCWVNRAMEVFDTDEGKAMLKKWGIEGDYIGVGNCILGYPAAEKAPAAPRKADYIYKV